MVEYNIDLILTSPLPRVKDSTDLINETLQKQVIVSEFLAEVKWPSVLEGKKLSDSEVVEYRKLRNENNIAKTSWHFSDEENFIDLKNRVRSLLSYISTFESQTVLAVTSSTFMKVLVMVMCHGDDVTWQTYYDFLNFTRPTHTSISTFHNDPEDKWYMDQWNLQS